MVCRSVSPYSRPRLFIFCFYRHEGREKKKTVSCLVCVCVAWQMFLLIYSLIDTFLYAYAKYHCIAAVGILPIFITVLNDFFSFFLRLFSLKTFANIFLLLSCVSSIQCFSPSNTHTHTHINYETVAHKCFAAFSHFKR